SGEPAGHGGVIGGGAGEGAGGQLLAQGQGRGTVGLQGLDDQADAFRVDGDGDMAVVLRTRADHGRAADVDVLDGGFKAAALLDRLLERVEVDPDDIDGADAVLAHGGG